MAEAATTDTLLHASAVARDTEAAVLLLGPPGAGKSDLTLRLIQAGWLLVGDDQLRLRAEGRVLRAEPPAALRGLLEVRGLGIFADLAVADPAPALRLAVHLAAERAAVPRLPQPATWSSGTGLILPVVTLYAFDASAPAKVVLALDAAIGRVAQRAGAFA